MKYVAMSSATTTHQFEQNFKLLSICDGAQTVASGKKMPMYIDMSSQHQQDQQNDFRLTKKQNLAKKNGVMKALFLPKGSFEGSATLSTYVIFFNGGTGGC